MLISDLGQAITRFENVDPNRGLNNPGAIWDMKTNGLRQYSSYEEGYAAMMGLIGRVINKGVTLREFFGGKPGVYPGYAPRGHGNNDPDNYAETVGRWLGIPVDVPLIELDNQGGTVDGGNRVGTNTPVTSQSNIYSVFTDTIGEFPSYLSGGLHLGSFGTTGISYSSIILLMGASYLGYLMLRRLRGV